MKTIILFVLLNNGIWIPLLPAGPEMNSLEACQTTGESIPKTNPEVPLTAWLCKELDEEEAKKYKTQAPKPKPMMDQQTRK